MRVVGFIILRKPTLVARRPVVVKLLVRWCPPAKQPQSTESSTKVGSSDAYSIRVQIGKLSASGPVIMRSIMP